MNEVNIEYLKERALKQESRIEELQQRQFEEKSDETVYTDPVYDLYLDEGYLFLNLDLPGVLEREIRVELEEREVRVRGEFPRLMDGKEAEYLHRQRAFGSFDYQFLLPADQKVERHDWQLIHGVLQIRMYLSKNDAPGLLTE